MPRGSFKLIFVTNKVRALDAEALQNVTLSANLTSTVGVVVLRAGRASQASVRHT